VTVFEIKQHDLEPDLVIDISGSAGDLSTVVSWKVLAKSIDGTVLWTDTNPGHVVGSPTTTAVITHDWVAGETDLAGTQLIEVQAMWPSSRPQTFPVDGYETVRVVADLG
jgi:hypothetical protein